MRLFKISHRKKTLFFLTTTFILLLSLLVLSTSLNTQKVYGAIIGGGGGGCTSNNDCAYNQFCNNGTCTALSCNGNVCASVYLPWGGNAMCAGEWMYSNHQCAPGGCLPGSTLWCQSGACGANCNSGDSGCNLTSCYVPGGGGGGGGGSGLCPGPGEAKTYYDGSLKNCYSSTGLGYNTVGGAYQCGPVYCPPGISGTSGNGNSCIYSQAGGACYAGYGAGGFNPNGSTEPPGCIYNPNDNGTTITCPPKNQTITIQVNDTNGKAVPNIALTIYDNGHGNYTITTNSNGTATFNSWSGDHFMIWPQANPNYSFNSSQSNPVNGIVNTSWSCGTTTGWPNPSGNPNAPCLITAIAATNTVSGIVYTDYNHDGSNNNLDTPYTASHLTVQAVDSSGNVAATAVTSTTDGSYSMALSDGQKYTISIQTLPSSTQEVETIPVDLTGANPTNLTGQDIGITPLYSISGTVFMDNVIKDGKLDAGESAYTGPSNIIVTNTQTNTSTTFATANGAYNTPINLLSGSYVVKYDTSTTPLPPNYSFTTSSSWPVVVGNPAGQPPACSVGGSLDGTCGGTNQGSIYKLDFGLTNEITWTQGFCGDIRVDSGYNQAIPSSASCGGTSAPYAIVGSASICSNYLGILFSGSTTPVYGGGLGASAPPNGQVVGDGTFPENFASTFSNSTASSSNFVNTTLQNASVPPTPLKNICPLLTNCVLSELTPGGVYTTTATDGPVSLSVSNTDGTFQLGQTNYVFVIGGDLTFTSNVLTQAGYAAAFISSGDIHVAGNVGETDWTSLAPDLQGFFSADKNFYIDPINPAGSQCLATGQPKEKKLNIKGSVITNAAGGGGTVIPGRDGCLQDLSCPAVTYTQDPLVLLHAPGPLKPPYTFWQELNP